MSRIPFNNYIYCILWLRKYVNRFSIKIIIFCVFFFFLFMTISYLIFLPQEEHIKLTYEFALWTCQLWWCEYLFKQFHFLLLLLLKYILLECQLMAANKLKWVRNIPFFPIFMVYLSIDIDQNACFYSFHEYKPLNC